DLVENAIKKTGCLELHYNVQECMADHKDWRKCQDDVKKFRRCMTDYHISQAKKSIKK
ncbi:hypothetical protein CAPTEDRAFT_31064, partial [Capitella teleta]